MINRITPIYIFVVILFSGCSNKLKLEGKWSYLNSQEEYAEMWFDGEKVLLLDETAYAIEIFDYSIDGDSIFMIQESDTTYSIAFTLDQDLILKNKFVEYKLNKFSSSVPEILLAEDFQNSVYPEFTERAKAKR